MRKKILFISHQKTQCGVYEFGAGLFNAIKSSGKYEFIKIELESKKELEDAISKHAPVALFFNFHPSVMPWLCTKKAKGIYRNNVSEIPLPQLAVIHEITQDVADNATGSREKYLKGPFALQWNSLFDYYVAADPTLLLKNNIVFKTGRIIPAYNKPLPDNKIPVIGSYGFGTAKKGFERIVAKVQEEFDEAIVRLNIPYAHYGDTDGANARLIAQNCREILKKPGIKLEISHDFMGDEQIMDFLAGNDINVFLYEDKEGRGISSAIDFALAVRRPIAVSDSSMFRHILTAKPPINIESSSLKTIMNNGFGPLQKFADEWTEDNMVWETERIFDRILEAPVQQKKEGLVKSLKKFLKRKITGKTDNFTWLRNTKSVTDDNMDVVPGIQYEPVKGNLNFNRILDDAARKIYEPTIAFMTGLLPKTMAKKIPRANVQQAFVFDTVYRYIQEKNASKILCVGSYEDTASMSLIKMGYEIEEIDPMINYFLQEYYTKPSVKKNYYEIIFSTSVIEHDPDDKSFIECVGGLLAPGGVAVITMDYKDGWDPADLKAKPDVDARFYTKKDLEQRLLSYLPGCELVDMPDWDCPNPDFILENRYQYTFATFVFRKVK